MWFGERHERDRSWRGMMRLVRRVYRFTESFPAEEKANLTASMRKTAVSLPSQIAEGVAAEDPAALAGMLDRCREGVRQLQTLTALAGRLGYGRWWERMRLRRWLRGAAGALSRRAARLRAGRSEDAAAACGEAAPPRPTPAGRRAMDEACRRGAVRRLRFRHLPEAV